MSEIFSGKVSICGVDTSKLRVLKEKEKEELLRRYKAGDLSARDELVNGNVVLVDNTGDKKYDVVRINSYEVFVVSSKNSSKSIPR